MFSTIIRQNHEVWYFTTGTIYSPREIKVYPLKKDQNKKPDKRSVWSACELSKDILSMHKQQSTQLHGKSVLNQAIRTLSLCFLL